MSSMLSTSGCVRTKSSGDKPRHTIFVPID
jgi:hypothetical protein